MPWIHWSRPREPSLASSGLVVWLVTILVYDALGFLYFCFVEGRGPSAILPSSGIVWPIPPAATLCFCEHSSKLGKEQLP